MSLQLLLVDSQDLYKQKKKLSDKMSIFLNEELYKPPIFLCLYRKRFAFDNRIPSIIDAWLSSSDIIASSGPSKHSKIPALASKQLAYRIASFHSKKKINPKGLVHKYSTLDLHLVHESKQAFFPTLYEYPKAFKQSSNLPNKSISKL